MSRGRQLCTLKKEWYWKAKCETTAKLEAEREFNARPAKEKKLAFADFTNYFINKIRDIDPIDLLAVGGLTIIIQPIVLSSEVYLNHLKKNPAILGITVLNPILGMIAGQIPQPGDKPLDQFSPEVILSYIMAFIIAAIFVKYLPKMMSGAQKIGDFINVQGLLSGLLI